MSIRVTFNDGIFKPIEDVKGLRPGQPCSVFSDDELREIRETMGWLKFTGKSVEFWNDAVDAPDDET